MSDAEAAKAQLKETINAMSEAMEQVKRERDEAHQQLMDTFAAIHAALDEAGIHDPRADIRDGDHVDGGFAVARVRALVEGRDKARAEVERLRAIEALAQLEGGE